jgi:hypothetical protein
MNIETPLFVIFSLLTSIFLYFINKRSSNTPVNPVSTVDIVQKKEELDEIKEEVSAIETKLENELKDAATKADNIIENPPSNIANSYKFLIQKLRARDRIRNNRD